MTASSLVERPRIAGGLWVRAGLMMGVIAALAFIAVDLVDAMVRPGYSILRHWVSHRALGDLGWVGTLSLVATALLLLACGVSLLVLARSAMRRSGYPAAICVAGVALTVAAIWPMDPSLSYPPHVEPAAPTVSGTVHDVAGPAFIVALAVAAFVARRLLRLLSIEARWSRFGWVVGSAIVLAFALTTVLVSLDYAEVVPEAWSGMCERLAIYLGLCWNALVVWRLDRAVATTT